MKTCGICGIHWKQNYQEQIYYLDRHRLIYGCFMCKLGDYEINGSHSLFNFGQFIGNYAEPCTLIDHTDSYSPYYAGIFY